MILSRIINKILVNLIFLKVVFFSKIFGLSFAVQYLRNPNPKTTVKILKYFKASIGQNTTFKRTIIIDNSYEDIDSKGDFSNIILGENCYIGDSVYFDLANQIIIEDNAVVSGKVSFITHSDCNRSKYLNEKFPRKSSSILVKQGAWIGFGATILSGSVIGEESVLAANSLLNVVTEKHKLYAGIPAKMISKIS